MQNRYSHLLSPVKIGNITLKNRLLNSKCVSSDNMEPERRGAGVRGRGSVPGL